MNTDELRAKVGDQEDNFVERKSQGVSAGEARQTATAFANALPQGREAVLFIGINDKSGAIEGVANPDAVQKRVRDAIGECYPPIAYTAEVLNVDGKAVVAFVFSSSSGKPHFAGAAFVRVGSESLRANEVQFDALIASRNSIVAAILAHKGKVAVVHAIGHHLGNQKPLADAAQREGCECVIEDCNARFVTLMRVSDNVRFDEQVAWVTVAQEHGSGRPLLASTYPR